MRIKLSTLKSMGIISSTKIIMHHLYNKEKGVISSAYTTVTTSWGGRGNFFGNRLLLSAVHKRTTTGLALKAQSFMMLKDGLPPFCEKNWEKSLL